MISREPVAGRSCRAIAATMGRHHSMVARKVARMAAGTDTRRWPPRPRPGTTEVDLSAGAG
ncbi:helix-turn-helix domain-containing protein [Actinokineospora bangkokensis]|uniref:helix-turn-helix domain-containing protein n=1 Tax=Actinokineospora bangkokensis TaxID=1193682 RepID=UPI00096B41BF